MNLDAVRHSKTLIIDEYAKYNKFVLSLMIHGVITMVLCFWVLAGDNIPQELMAWKVFHVVAPMLALHLWYSTNFPLYYMATLLHASLPIDFHPGTTTTNASIKSHYATDSGFGRDGDSDSNARVFGAPIELKNMDAYAVDFSDSEGDAFENIQSKCNSTEFHHRQHCKKIIDRYSNGKDRVNRGSAYIMILYAILLLLDLIYLGVILIPTLIKCLGDVKGGAIPSECDGWTSTNNGKVLFGFTVFFSISHVLSEISVILVVYLNKSQGYEIFFKDHHE